MQPTVLEQTQIADKSMQAETFREERRLLLNDQGRRQHESVPLDTRPTAGDHNDIHEEF